MILTGLARIVRDTECRYTHSGDAVASISLVFSYGKKGQDGYKPSQFFDAALWGKQAESLTQYLTKGKQVVVSVSDPHIDIYKKNDGTSGSKLIGNIISIEFCSDGNSINAGNPRTQTVRSYNVEELSSQTKQDIDNEDIPF